MAPWVLFLLFQSVLQTPCLALNFNDGNLNQFILEYFQYYQIKTAIIFACQNKDLLFLVKNLIPYGIKFNLINMDDFHYSQLELLLEDKYHQIGIILDISCPTSLQILKQASLDENFFDRDHHWLLIDESSIVDYEQQSNKRTSIDQPLFHESLGAVRFDSRVVWVSSGPENLLQLHDFYRIGGTKRELLHIQWHWTSGQLARRPLVPRENFQASQLKTAIVVVEDPWEHWQDINYGHLNPASKMGYSVALLFAEIHNFTIEALELDTWGYTKVNGTYGGVIGLLQTKQIDFGTGILLKQYRLDYCDYTSHFHQFRPRFIFRRPPISATQNIYLLTFSNQVWYCFGVITFLGAITLCITEYLGDKSQPFEDQDGWYDFFFLALASIFQQGGTSSPNKISSRIVFWCLLLMAVIYDNSYSAAIVVLLQSSDNLIKTIPDLIASPFKLKMQNVEYNTHLINITRSSVVKKLFWKKLFTQPWDEAFVDPEVGVAAVRKGMFAFYCDVGSNKYILDTFETHEKCELDEIYMNPPEGIHFALQKGSQYIDLFSRDLLLLREVGLMDRWHSHWYPTFPKCQNDQSHGFVSVSIQDFHPAIAIFFFGVFASILLMIIEIIYAQFIKKRNPQRKVK